MHCRNAIVQFVSCSSQCLPCCIYDKLSLSVPMHGHLAYIVDKRMHVYPRHELPMGMH